MKGAPTDNVINKNRIVINNNARAAMQLETADLFLKHLIFCF